MAFGSDNIDRVLDDLQKACKMLPPPEISDLLYVWQKRTDNERLDAAAWRQAIVELRAACAVMRGDGRNAMRLMLGEEQI